MVLYSYGEHGDSHRSAIVMERNIFEAAAKELRKSPKPAEAQAAKSPVPLPAQPVKGEFGERDPEICQMLEKMRQMRFHLETQLTDLHEMEDKYHFDLERFVKSQGNMSPKELEKMIQQGQLFEAQVNSVIKSNSGIAAPRPKSKEALEKERKAKTLGSRKKNWISVR